MCLYRYLLRAAYPSSEYSFLDFRMTAAVKAPEAITCNQHDDIICLKSYGNKGDIESLSIRFPYLGYQGWIWNIKMENGFGYSM